MAAEVRDHRKDEAEPSLAETIDTAARRIMTGLVIGGAAIALGIYAAQPELPRYEVDVMGSTVIRTNIRTGGVLACEGERCYVLIQRGSQRGNSPVPKAMPAPQPPQQALPAPAREPAPKALPAPAREAGPEANPPKG